MFAHIIDWSIRNRLLVILGTLFIVAAGTFSLTRMPIDAIPDLSDVQVIIQTEYPGQAPRIVEDQVTYPLTTQMLAAPFAQVVRGYSFFGVSFVYVIFEDGDRPLLGAQPRPRIPEHDRGPAAARCDSRTRPRRDGCGVGLHVRAQVRPPRPRRTALDPGLVPQVRVDGGAGGCRRWRAWGDSCASTR